MKKFIVILAMMLCCVLATSAQEQHLNFMGIPLTGTINQFQQKLAAKGVTYDKKASAISDNGTRVFKGTFAGSKATIVVWYDVKTKIVHGAKAYFECASTNLRDQKYDDLKSMLKEKYADEYSETEEKDGHEQFAITVTDSTGQIILGFITLYCKASLFSYGEHTVHVEYDDLVNSVKNQNNKMSDL